AFGPTQRIDCVLTRGGLSADGMTVEGTHPGDKTASGLWPSDHAAIVAKLDLPKHITTRHRFGGNRHAQEPISLATKRQSQAVEVMPGTQRGRGSLFRG